MKARLPWRGDSPVFLVYLNVALLILLFSYFFVDSAKSRNNIYYVFFALPVFLVGVSVVWRTKLEWAGLCLLIYFFGALLAEWLAGDSVFGLLKHQLYLLLLFFGLKLCLQQERVFRVTGLVYVVGCIALTCLATYQWLELYFSTGVIARIELYAAASNPVHASLMIMTGWLGFWMTYGLPRLRERGQLAFLAGFALMLGFAFLICIIFQSRSALLGLLAATGAWLVLGQCRRLSVLVVGIVVLLVVIIDGYEALLARGVSYRTGIWLEALTRWRDTCSWGFGCAEAGEPLYLSQFHHAHSAYISILVDTGVLGAITFAVFALAYFVQGVRVRSHWFIVSLVGWAGVLATSNGLVDSPRPLWIYFWLPTLLALLDYQREVNTSCDTQEQRRRRSSIM